MGARNLTISRNDVKRLQEDLSRAFKHIAKSNEELGNVEDKLSRLNTKIATIQTDMDWIKKFFWIVATASIGGLVTTLLSVLL